MKKKKVSLSDLKPEHVSSTHPIASDGGLSISIQINSIPISPFLNLLRRIPLISNSYKRWAVRYEPQ